MPGLSRRDGSIVSGFEHVVLSLEDLLSTPIGSRVMRRTYGSMCPFLIDAPMTSSTLLKWYVAVADAIDRWEPRFDLRAVLVVQVEARGRIQLALAGTYYPRGHLGDRSASEPIPDMRVLMRSV